MDRWDPRRRVGPVAPLLLLLVADAFCATSAALFGGAKTPELAMIEWLKTKGCETSVTIAAPPGGFRGTYAAKPIPRDGLLAKIPLSTGVWFPSTYSDFAELGVMLARKALEGGGKGDLAPYFNALPMLRDPMHTASFETFPADYAHLIQSDAMSSHIITTQAGTLNFWSSHGLELSEEGITLPLLRAALVTVATRYFGITHRGISSSVMIPLIDFANHYQNCTNYYEYRPCTLTDKQALDAASGTLPDEEEAKLSADTAEKEELCVFWRAGRDLKAGEEVCNRYGYTAPDQAFFQYGFHLPDEPPPLARVDEHHFSPEYIYGAKAHEEPSLFDGPVDALEGEAARIRAQIAMLRRGEAAQAKAVPCRDDPGGSVLEGLAKLRSQRLRALENELKRVEGRIAEGGLPEPGTPEGREAAKEASKWVYTSDEGDSEL